MKELYLDSLIKNINKQQKSFGRFKKFAYDFRYLGDKTGSISRLVIGAILGGIVAYFGTPLINSPYIVATAVCGLFTLVPPIIRNVGYKGIPSKSRIFKVLAYIKEDIKCTNDIIKKEIKNFNNLKGSMLTKRDGRFQSIVRMYLALQDSYDNINQKLNELYQLAIKSKNKKLTYQIFDLIENFKPLDKITYLTNETGYAVNMLNQNRELDIVRDLGNKLVMLVDGGFPYKTYIQKLEEMKYNGIQAKSQHVELNR